MRFVRLVILFAAPIGRLPQGPIVKVFIAVLTQPLGHVFNRAEEGAMGFYSRIPLPFAPQGQPREGTMMIATTPLITVRATEAAYAADHERGAVERSLTVCIDVGSGPSTLQARSLASSMFARIGVMIHWRLGLHDCPPQAIVVGLMARTPPTLMPGSLAYSLPYEGRHIVVFYDRIVQDHPDVVKALLAHVLAHEITHLLQAENRHSASGIMKARWGENDYEDMKRGALAFTAEDIDLIYRGLAARARAKGDAEAK